MNPESEIERPLRIRLFVASCVFLLVAILNIVLNVRGDSVRGERNDKIAAQNAELQSRITEVESVLAEAAQLRQQASDLVDQTVKTANGEKPSASGSNSSAPAKKTP
jgi:F0F1-type ATP synthase membrane subunit b/b'